MKREIQFSKMRNIFSTLLLVLCVLFAYDSNAQLSKKEAKEWKKKIKALKPEQYKTLLEQNKSLSSQVSSLKSETSGFDSKLEEKDSQISSYKDQVSDLRSQLSRAKEEASAKQEKPASNASGPVIDTDGVVFRVQIGAFRNKDLSKYLNNSSNFAGEIGEDGLKRYSLGYFRDYWEANTFKQYLREMGVKGAFIVPFKDGVKVEIKDVLEGVIK